MKKYSTPDIYMLGITKDDIMVDIFGSGNIGDVPGDDVHNPTLAGGGTGNTPIGGSF